MGCVTALLLGILWWVCLALLVTGEGSGLLLIFATLAILIWIWGEMQDEENGTSCH